MRRPRRMRFLTCAGVSFIFWLTSKMSHDHSRHDSCSLRLYSRWIHSLLLSLARGMTAVVVGSGALLGLCSIAWTIEILGFIWSRIERRRVLLFSFLEPVHQGED